MKKFFLLTACLIACLALNAQDTKVAITSAIATSDQNGEDASRAIDGETSTLWHSSYQGTSFPVTFTLAFENSTYVDYVRYVPRVDGSTNGHWNEVTVAYCSTKTGSSFENLGSYTLNGEGSVFDFPIGKTCGQVKFTINSGRGGWASASEITAYAYDTEKIAAFEQYFDDALYSQLKSNVTSSNGIADSDVKALVDAMLADPDGYKKFRVGEYEPYMTLASAKKRVGNKNPYSKYENPTGIYLKEGESCIVAVSGLGTDPVKLKIKNWVENTNVSSYPLHNGLNYITATSTGNVFVDYYTDNEEAENVEVHFINAPVLGYWDAGTMTNDDWKALLNGKSKDDNTILMVQSEHVQLAYPISAWLTHCPEKVTELMALYEEVQWAQRDILGLAKFDKEVTNRQFFFAKPSGNMSAGDEGASCAVASLGGIMTPDREKFDFWGVAHEWGHNNQIENGFHWTGCGETTNNIYASWAQIHSTPNNLRLEDEVTGIDEYKSMRGGRMQAYFEEGIRKGNPWQLQEGPDYYEETPTEVTVTGRDENGADKGQVATTWRHYDHFVKLAPFWQLNLWGTLAGKCPDIIPMVIESIRTTENYTTTYNTNGKQQINWMKLACDKSGLNLLPFFEKAGMLRPINAYVDDYAKDWNIITEAMINELKDYVATKEYPTPGEEINYINGHNYLTYKEKKALSVPATLGEGCVISGKFATVDHAKVVNAVAFETYNIKGELMRITMYGLGSDDAHSFTQVLFPSDAAYIMAVGYDGTRKMIYHNAPIEITTDVNNPIYYTIYNTRSSQPGGLIYYAGDAIGLKDGCTSLQLESKYQFYFTGSHDAMYIHNKATGKKLASADSWTDEGAEWAIGVSPVGNGWAIGPKGGLNGDKCLNEKNQAQEADKSDFTTYSANDAGSVFVLEKVETHIFPEAGKFYVIECPLFYNKQGVHKGLYVDGEGNLGWNTIDATDKNYYWQLVRNGDVVSLKNLGTGTYLNGNEMGNTASNATINYLGSNNFNITANSVIVHANGHGGGSNASGSIVSYGGVIGTASAWTFVEKQNPDAAQKVTVKYIFKHNGTEVATQEVETLIGEEYPKIVIPYGVIADTEKFEGTIKAGDATNNIVTKNINVTYDLPFVPAVDYAGITKWYYVKFDSNNGYYLYNSADKNHISLDQKSVAVDSKDAYTWAFVGNPFGGFKVVNKATGASKVLSSSTTMAGETGAETWPIMTATPVPQGNNELWMVSASTHAEGGFFMAQKGYSNHRLNNRGGKLAYWTGGAGTGSTFTVEERDLSGATELQTLVDAVKSMVEQWGEGTTVGHVKAESKQAVSTAITAAEAAIASKEGCNEAQVTLQAAVDAIEIVLPSEGKFYRMTNHFVNNNVMYVNGDNGLSHKSGAISDASDVFQFVPTKGGFYLYNVARGTYLSTAKDHGAGQNYSEVTSVDNATVLAIASFNDGTVPQVSLTPAGGATLHADTNYGTVVGWNASSNSKSAWYVNEVSAAEIKHTLSVSDARWASLVLGFNATIPSGVTAYVVSSYVVPEQIAGEAIITPISGNVLPANTPVLINAAEGNYSFEYTTATATVENNLLEGKPYNTYHTTVAGTTNYVLSYKGEDVSTIGLYKKTVLDADLSDDDEEKDDEGKVITPVNDHIAFFANKAYLPVATSNGAAPMLRITRGDDATGIQDAELTIDNGQLTIYDITGRRVEKMEKGIYIVNGRKVVIK